MTTKQMMGSAALVALMLGGLTTVAMADRMGRGAEGPFPLMDFAAIDADKDGKLSAAELKAQAMERAGARADDMVARMIERHDTDGDGLISVAEMAAGPSPLSVFDRIDSDKDGAISVEEAEAARKHMAKRMGKHRGHGGPDDGPLE